MDARAEAAQLIQESNDFEKEPTRLLHLAVLRILGAIDEDIQKLRKELRTRNVSSSASLDFEGQRPSDGGENG